MMPLSPAVLLLVLGALITEPIAMASSATVAATESGSPPSTTGAAEAGKVGSGGLAGPSSAEQAQSGKCPSTITVGYQRDIPFGDDAPRSMARTLIDETFANSGFNVAFERYPREALAASIVSGRVQLGVVAVAAIASQAAPEGPSSSENRRLSTDQLIPTTNVHGVEALPLALSSYSVVTRARQLNWIERLLERFEQGWLAQWLWLPLGAALGVLTLALCALALNLRLPSVTRTGNSTNSGPTQGQLIIGSVNRVDAQLTALSRTGHWLLLTSGGRLFGIVWACFGAAVAALAIEGGASRNIQPLTDDAVKRSGAAEAAYPGSKILEYRHGKWRECDRPFDCLADYQQGHTAALAGDHDVLCQYAESFGALRLFFDDEIAVPVLYTLLLPEPEPGQGESCRRRIRDTVALALRRPMLAKSPWESCGD